MSKRIAVMVGLAFGALMAPAAMAGCQGKLFDPVTDVCWKCLFPLTIGASAVSSSDLPDTDNPASPVCACLDGPWPKLGIALGYWEPMALIEITRTPYCLVNLGGQHLPGAPAAPQAQGAVETQSPDQNGGFYEAHYYNLPLLQMLGSALLGGSCKADGQLGLAYLSELDPTWHDEALAAIVFPETAAFAAPAQALAAHAACAADSAQASIGLPSDTAFWCAGGQGLMYPLTGKVAEQASAVQATALLAERLVFKLHRLGRIADTHKGNLCHAEARPFMPKSRYRYQMVYPRASACQPFGRPTVLWEAGQMSALSNGDASYLIWRKRNCCNYE